MEDNTGSAFPSFHAQGDFYGTQGLTKREYFAAMAMQGLQAIVADVPLELLVANPERNTRIARSAVDLADALLAALAAPAAPAAPATTPEVPSA